jgi:hypothetical protein
MSEHDPENWVPVCRHDHAHGMERTGATVETTVQKVCGMIERRNTSADRVVGAGCLLLFISLAPAMGLFSDPLYADSIKNPIAVFAALDKVTGRISHLEIPIDQTVEFGALKVTPRVCDTTPPTEAPHTASFVEVDEVNLKGEVQRIFTGWMFAESPGLHAVEHPVFDVWLTSCKTPNASTAAGSNENAPAPEAPADAAEAPPAETPPAAEAPPVAAEPPPAAAAEAPPAPKPPKPAAEAPIPLPWATKPPANAASRNR